MCEELKEINENSSEKPKKSFFSFLNTKKVKKLRKSRWVNILFFIFIPMISVVTCEWIARGTLGAHDRDRGFFDALKYDLNSFIITYLLLLFCYILMTYLFKNHLAGVISIGILANVPAVVTYYKLNMRNEPFLPWDLMQIDDLMGIAGEVSFTFQPTMIFTLVIFIVLSILSFFIIIPLPKSKKKSLLCRLFVSVGSTVAALIMVFGVFLNSTATEALGIKEDMWMQDRYYRYHGVITGFLTNLQLLNIDVPKDYSAETVENNLESIDPNREPYYENSPALTGDYSEETPDIIFLMAEGFWDMERLPGLSFDRELTPNFNRLVEESASGWAFTPSYGGGTCDVEFEVLTGSSMEFFPSGSKPYQQYITDETFSIAWHLKDQGYETLAIHGYGERFWNRDVAYPRLGIDIFISEEDMQDAQRRRGFISDMAMVDRIIEEQQNRSSDDNPVFIHAVTMQNHTTYSPDRYPKEDLVQITDNSAGISEEILGEVQDCATGMTEMDAALGYLTDYLSTIERPTIVVFWGDHLNPMSNGRTTLLTDTGFMLSDEEAYPQMYQTPLLIWSNMASNKVDLGTVSTYNISPIMMDLYGLEMPPYFDFLSQQLSEYTASNKGMIFYPDGNMTYEIGDKEEALLYSHKTLQYDLLFGEQYQLQDDK